jgi:hypothetical protein
VKCPCIEEMHTAASRLGFNRKNKNGGGKEEEK